MRYTYTVTVTIGYDNSNPLQRYNSVLPEMINYILMKHAHDDPNVKFFIEEKIEIPVIDNNKVYYPERKFYL